MKGVVGKGGKQEKRGRNEDGRVMRIGRKGKGQGGRVEEGLDERGCGKGRKTREEEKRKVIP